jgi:hypothetical protein
MAKNSVMKCPKKWCWRTAIHAKAIDLPLLDQEGDYGWSLTVECPKHGWQSKGDEWTRQELIEAGLTSG